MSDHQHNNRVEFDRNGNIIIKPDVQPVVRVDAHPHSHRQHVQRHAPAELRPGQWTTLEEPAQKLEKPVQKHATPTPARQKRRARRSFLQKLTGDTRSLVEAALHEGGLQFSDTVREASVSFEKTLESTKMLPRRASWIARRFWKSAEVPCGDFLPERVKHPKSKIAMFVFDMLRFGGTFALIFVTLFVGINYQSFWQITKSSLAIGLDTGTEQALQDMLQEAPATGGAAARLDSRRRYEASSLLTYLPKVGPHENRLVISKIGKNVPIVLPSMDKLVTEDWKGFEDDVQHALQEGVVHYPGSAWPGRAGNFFITGHSSYYPWAPGDYKDVFARLHELEPGDTYSVYYGGDKHVYKVTGKKEVKPTDVSVLDQPTNRRLSTLMTCTPIGTTLRRLIVMAEEIDPATGLALEVGQRGTVADGGVKPVKMEALPI